jgi:hypothetical protein
MKQKLKELGSLKLGKELTKSEMKNVLGGNSGSCSTVCSQGTYFGFCSPGYCAGAGHGTFQGCNGTC